MKDNNVPSEIFLIRCELRRGRLYPAARKAKKSGVMKCISDFGLFLGKPCTLGQIQKLMVKTSIFPTFPILIPNLNSNSILRFSINTIYWVKFKKIIKLAFQNLASSWRSLAHEDKFKTLWLKVIFFFNMDIIIIPNFNSILQQFME